MRGIVILVPTPNNESQLPLSNQESPPFIIQLVDWLLEQIFVSTSSSSLKIHFPIWLAHSQKFMYLQDAIYIRGHMVWDLKNNLWDFSQRRKNSIVLFGVTLPNFCQDFKKYIDDGFLIPCWHNGKNFTLASASHMSADTPTPSIALGSISKAINQNI